MFSCLMLKYFDAEILETHSRPVRWMHWINFPLLALMIWSGLRIYWADQGDQFELAIGETSIIKLFPDWFYDFFGLSSELAACEGSAHWYQKN